MLKRISHIVLALLLLISTTGMTVSLHYCNNSLYDIGVFTRADNCCLPDENMDGTVTHDHCAAGIHQKGHCEDETITVGSVDDFVDASSRAVLNINMETALSCIKTLGTGLHPRPNPYDNSEVSERDNAPPGVTSEPSFLQSFLI